MRLHLLVLLDLRSSPTVLPSLLSTPVETSASPLGRKLSTVQGGAISGYARAADSLNFLSGGDGGSRTRVQKSFALKGLQQYLNFTFLLQHLQELVRPFSYVPFPL